MAFAERIREKVAGNRFLVSGVSEIRITASIGVATYPSTQPESVEDLFRAADAALYRAKGSGRNLVRT
ncbi:MAG: diguanylate cyclase [Gemmatimonadaceae bacterium]